MTHSSADPRKISHIRLGAFVLVLILVPALFAVHHFRALQQKPAMETDPLPSPALKEPETLRREEGVFRRNETVTEALLDKGLPGVLVQQIVDRARPDYNLAMVRAGSSYCIRFDQDDRFRDFRYPIDSDRYLTVYHDVSSDSLVSVVKPFPYETRLEYVSAVIQSSLFLAVTDAGEKDQLALDLEEIFNSDIDFYIDIQKEDSFGVFVEKKYLDGEFVKYGAIMAASFTNHGRKITGFRFEDKNGKPAFYDSDGKSLKKSFLKSPLKFSRISSGFSLGRMHPILKIVRPHLGVDYAAPTGTPVRAVGSGVVIETGRSGEGGNTVRLRHPHGYETTYMHLSRIAVKRGAGVSQGQVIGYVGSTGLATGPHLDFRIRRNGKALNPTKVIYPPGDPVEPEKFAQFAAVRDSWTKRFESENSGKEPELAERTSASGASGSR